MKLQSPGLNNPKKVSPASVSSSSAACTQAIPAPVSSAESTPKTTKAPKTPNSQIRSSSAVKSTTPKSIHSRAGWTVIFVKVGSKIQIQILCQRSNGAGMGPYSSAPSASKQRPSWEPVNGCDYLDKGDHTKTVFEFKNVGNEQARFRADLMAPLMVKVDQFTQILADLLVNKPRLLAAYLSLLSFSEGFSNHDSVVHETNGMRKDGEGFVAVSIEQLGGSMKDFEEFIEAAVNNAIDIGGKEGSLEGVKISPASRKRRLTDYFNKSNPKKLSKSEIKEKNFHSMISEEGGLEKTSSSSYFQVQQICLDKLVVSPDLFLPVNISKVNELAESMSER